ncbi:MAG TPA: hypothetical protein VFK11_03985 [Candidatus Saccharimonadales bacterium]|nr:hypothetical protein [Candidatus Saccharimonadales bacterium]
MSAEILEFKLRAPAENLEQQAEPGAEEAPEHTEELAEVIPIDRAMGEVAVGETGELEPPVSVKVGKTATGSEISKEAKAKSSKGGGSSWWPCCCCDRVAKLGNCRYTYGNDRLYAKIA